MTVQTNTAMSINPSKISRLGSGAKAGVGVSSTVGGLSLLAALAYLLVRSKSGEQKTSPEQKE